MSSSACVVGSTRDGRLSHLSRASAPPTPQMWNHSSRSTVRMLARRSDGILGAFAQDEGGDGLDRSQHLPARLLIPDLDSERSLELQHELEHVNRIETEPLAEQGGVVTDVARRY